MIKKIVSATFLSCGLLLAQISSATTFDFEKYADVVYGEKGYAWGEFSHTEDGVTVYAEGAVTFDPAQWVNNSNYMPGEAYAYLDKGQAGLGVCKVIDSKKQCAPNSDDNVQIGEALGLWFTDSNDYLVDVTIEEILFRNVTHGKNFGANDTFWVMVDGVANEYSLTHVFTTALTGSEFVFWTEQKDTQFYLSAIDISDVPGPAPLALLTLGLLGIYSTSRKKQALN